MWGLYGDYRHAMLDIYAVPWAYLLRRICHLWNVCILVLLVTVFTALSSFEVYVLI